CFSRALRLSHESGTVLWRGRFSLGLALVHRARGDNEAALDEIDEAITLLSELGSPHETAISRAWQARIWLDDQRYPLAQRWAEHANLLPLNDPAAAERHIEYATFMRLIFTEGGKEADVLPRIERFRRLAVADERIGHAIEYDILAAIALQSAGRSSEAVARLDQAMTMASPGGYVRIFADEGERLAPLLQRIAAQGRHREFALRLLQTIGVNQESDQPDGPAPPNPLSDRELDVLRLAATGLSNRAIGDRLFITDKTAKKHISNILSKLEASNRTEAVDRARRLGLLHD
ncbi:MAG: LuxR C-terminal-related transcriptional regulator, partial [Thermomicrobiales bacterium]